ncbi:hypothetical protein D9758_007222 [Tetrapyrgos nigripes]|uniref:Large ribosomal subunit protein mL44 n=1 Tax=Tetrapyrgos nigripes TaxID=182062 RepID=A0A8H5D1N7_9AGAR|nr:hypothetical protein D9758_007222 [Tetrapyrgos nigripes]
MGGTEWVKIQRATMNKPALLHNDALASIPRSLTALIYQRRSLPSARQFVQSYFLSREVDIRSMIKFTDPKKALVEMVEKFQREKPKSRLLKETGRYSNAPMFVVGIFCGEEEIGQGFGGSLKMAEYRAAEDALHRVYLTRTPSHLVQIPSQTFPLGLGDVFRQAPEQAYTAPELVQSEIILSGFQTSKMAVLSLPLNFNNSFWSHDYRKGVEVVFKKLEQGVAENDEIIAFIRSRAVAETQMASALSSPPTTNPAGSGFGADDGASLLMTFRGLHAEAASQAQAHLNVAKELESLVVDPFDQWAQSYKARIRQSRGVVLEQWLKTYEGAHGEVAKLKHQYLAKTRKADEAEDDAKFAPNGEGAAADHYTTSPRLRPSDARTPPQRTASVSERIATRLKEIQKRAAGNIATSESKEALDLPPVDKGKGKAVEEIGSPINIGSPLSMSPKQSSHDLRPPESPMPPMPPEPMLLAGLSLPPVAISQLLTRAASELNLRSVRFPLLGEYPGCFTGEEFVVWLNENVQGFGGSLDRAEDAAKELTERDGLLRRIGEFGNDFENSDEAWYQFRPKASSTEPPSHAHPPQSPISTSGNRPENILKRTNNFVNLVSKALAANNSNEPAWVKARKEAEEADKTYRIAVRQLDRQRLGLEEKLEDTLKTLQRWEMERLRAVKTVLLQYQGTLSNFPKTLEPIIERQTTLIAAYQPESDLTALVERYRTGPFRPHSHLYESVNHDESDVVFGIDLRKWAEGGWITEVMSPSGSEGGRKEEVPEVLTAMLGALEDKYKELANDEDSSPVLEKRKSWIYEVPLASTHRLRESLNAVFPDHEQHKEKPIPEDLFKPYDAPVIAATIKLWLLELEPPVATYEGWDEFRKLYPTHGRYLKVEGEEPEGHEKKLAEVSSALLKLPRVQLYVLDRVLKHFKTLIDTTTTEESNEVFVTKLALSVGRTILRPKVETEISIQDRHPTLLFIDLVNNYDEILPPTVTRKKRESERKLPVRKRTAMVDMRSTRSNRISASGLHHFLPKSDVKSPEIPPVPSLPSTISPSNSVPPPPPIVPQTGAIPPPPPIVTQSQTGAVPPPPPLVQPKPIPPPPSLENITPPVPPPPPPAAQPSADDDLPPRPAFKEPPPEDDDLPPRPTFKEPPPESEDEATPPRPNFAEPPSEESDSPSPESKMAPSPPPNEEQGLNAAKASVSRSSSGNIARSGRITRGPRGPGGGSVSSMVQNINRNSLPGSPTSPSSPSSKRFSGSAGSGSGSRPSSVLGRSAAFSRRTMHSDAEDDVVDRNVMTRRRRIINYLRCLASLLSTSFFLSFTTTPTMFKLRGFRGRRMGAINPDRKGTFDISDSSNVQHTEIGVWDLYEEIVPELTRLPFYEFWSSRVNVELLLELSRNAPFVWRMFTDILTNVEGCWWLLGILIPAITLWYSSQLLKIVQTAIDERTVDTSLLIHICIGRFACSAMNILLSNLQVVFSRPLGFRIRQFYTHKQIHCMARLDVPTFSDPSLQRQMQSAFGMNVGNDLAMSTVTRTMNIVTSGTRLVSQLGVLLSVLRDQTDGPLLAVICFVQTIFQHWRRDQSWIKSEVYAATTRNDDYLKMEGIKQAINSDQHRKEIVAGNMGKYMHSEYTRCSTTLGEAAADFNTSYYLYKRPTLLSFFPFMNEIWNELPQVAKSNDHQVVFALRAVQQPSSIPLSLASLTLITSTTTSFSNSLLRLFQQGGSIANHWADVRRFYEVVAVENRVRDGSFPFPENQKEMELSGVQLEFRNVSFKYPGSASYALQNVSFKILPGQLCVIVGKNGSGKSTILKLLMRLYDVDEGQILVDGRDIRSLKLEDLRKATAIKQNIALGDPSTTQTPNLDDVIEAAKLGGAHDFISRLPEEYDSFLDRPVRDVYSGLPEGTTALFGREVNFRGVRGRIQSGRGGGAEAMGLSGGQVQRIALSRTFMRSLIESQSAIGLLLFDEPSASLDPAAEHDLFERLRALRGQKTMIFSSHRFGNLTKHADLILYMDDSSIVEEGSHNDLLKKNGEYARIWTLQAQAFL